jgi:hypothetical protein
MGNEMGSPGAHPCVAHPERFDDRHIGTRPKRVDQPSVSLKASWLVASASSSYIAWYADPRTDPGVEPAPSRASWLAVVMSGPPSVRRPRAPHVAGRESLA